MFYHFKIAAIFFDKAKFLKTVRIKKFVFCPKNNDMNILTMRSQITERLTFFKLDNWFCHFWIGKSF